MNPSKVGAVGLRPLLEMKGMLKEFPGVMALAGKENNKTSCEDFRSFLKFLEEKNELRRVTREVDRYLETTLVTKASVEKAGPALLFENVKGHKIPVAVGVYGTRDRVCMGLGTTQREFNKESIRRSEQIKSIRAEYRGIGTLQGEHLHGR